MLLLWDQTSKIILNWFNFTDFNQQQFSASHPIFDDRANLKERPNSVSQNTRMNNIKKIFCYLPVKNRNLSHEDIDILIVKP